MLTINVTWLQINSSGETVAGTTPQLSTQSVVDVAFSSRYGRLYVLFKSGMLHVWALDAKRPAVLVVRVQNAPHVMNRSMISLW
jgi:hypothetical protein